MKFFYIISFILIQNYSASAGMVADSGELEEDSITWELQTHPQFPKPQGITFMPKKAPAPNTSSIAGYEQVLKETLKIIPQSSLKKGIEVYLEIINGKSYEYDAAVGSSNKGIIMYQSKTLDANSCFGKLAEAFYKDISNEDRKNNSRTRPSLDDESGKDANASLKPGWLFEKAMEYSNGDANLAINLIGLCGHDDTANGEKEYSSDKKQVEAQYLKVLDKMISHNKEEKSYYSIEELEKFRNKVVSGEVKLEAHDRKINCPSIESSLYLSKALGSEVDLSQEYKDKIATIQAPNKGKSVIPSKNYHILGSAYMACQLITQGVSPKIAETIEKIAAWGYRTIRINQKIKEDLGRFEQSETLYRHYKSHNRASKTTFDEWMRYPQNYEPLFKNFQHFEKKEKEILLDRWLGLYNAAKVMDSMTLGGNILGLSIPHTNLSLNFSEDPITKKIELLKKEKEEAKMSSEKTPLTLSQERKKAAEEKALTYLMDWDWTVKQHTIGARFAAENCKKKPLNHTLDQDACSAFDKKPGITCNIDYSLKFKNSIIPEDSQFKDTAVLGIVNTLENVSEKMNEQFLDPKLEVIESSKGLEIKGAY